jgi:predicted RNA-binding protein with PIN domain
MFIIDGHNLLHAIPKVDECTALISDLQLCRILDYYLKQTDNDGEIIFDGIGPPDKTGFDNLNRLEISFAGLDTDTDTVIEDKIRANSAPKRLIIVSSDRRIRKAARARKALSLKSEEFWNNVYKQLEKKRRKKEPEAKRIGLSESETKQWLKFFGLEQ